MSIDFSRIKKGGRIHFVGIGGISMSALASILIKKGYAVSGSDFKKSPFTDALVAEGAKIFIGHNEKNAEGADTLIYSAAIGPDNPERRYADEHNIPSAERSALLGEIEKMYKYPIDISGTHGKTSTTGMLAHIFTASESDPTVLIGGELSLIGSNKRVGSSEYFISEACEYHRSFLNFHPYIGIILDVEADHLDYYKDLDDIKGAFSDFADIVSGKVIVNADDKNAMDAVKHTKTPVITVSRRSENADYYAKDITPNSFGEYSFKVYKKGGLLAPVSLSVPGIHHVSNALCAFAAASELGLDSEKIAQGLHSFTGVKRRFELKADKNGIRVYDDYAHHPTEIKATLDALAAISANEKYIVFQPHTYTRTLTLFDDFVSVLKEAPHLVLLDIYAAREKDSGLVKSADLAAKIPGSYMAKDFDDAKNYLKNRVKPGDIVMTVGAGDVYKVGEKLIKEL